MNRACIALIVLLAGCESREIHIRASIPGPDGGEAPLANLPLVVLPYNRDSILKSLEQSATGPRPHVRELDSLFGVWREPFTRYARTSYRAKAVEDSLVTIRRRLDSLPRNDSAYQALYRRFADLNDTLAAVRERGEPAHRELERLRGRVIPRIDSLRREVTRWENSTFRSYESLVGEFTRSADPVADTTDPRGLATIRRKPGSWWVYAWTWDPDDPYRRWYWNLPVEGDTVVLDARTGIRQPRY